MNKFILAVLILMLSNTALAFERGEKILLNDVWICTEPEILVMAMDAHMATGKASKAIEVIERGAEAGKCEMVSVPPGENAFGYYQKTLQERVIGIYPVALVEVADTKGDKYYTVLYN